MSHALDEYTLWLESDGEVNDQLKNIISSLSNKTGSPAFEPHITLIGKIRIPLDEIRNKVYSLVKNTKHLNISCISIEKGDSYYKAIYLSCEKTKELMATNKAAQEIFGLSYEYEPHLSLMYGEQACDLPEVSLPINFEVHKISLWHARGEVIDWQKIAEFPLKK